MSYPECTEHDYFKPDCPSCREWFWHTYVMITPETPSTPEKPQETPPHYVMITPETPSTPEKPQETPPQPLEDAFCDYSLLNTMPGEVIKASIRLEQYFRKKGIKKWKLFGIQSREDAPK